MSGVRAGELITRRRFELGMSQYDLARELVTVSGRTTLSREDVSRWEREKRLPGPYWLNFLAKVLEVEVTDVRIAVQHSKRLRRDMRGPFDEGVGMLLSGDGWETTGPGRRISVSSVERLLERIYALDDAFGGGALWQRIDATTHAATGLFSETLSLAEGDRLRRALAGLTQVAGWLSIDASRHVEANQHLTTALYAAYETDDIPMASHILGYMSLHALYRDRLQEARSLARTALDRAAPSRFAALRAILTMRLARCHARFGDAVACHRALDLAASIYRNEDAPLWLSYVDSVELVAQRGACLLELGDGRGATSAIGEAISLLQIDAPTRTRDVVHYKARLAAAYLLQSEPEPAAVAIREAYDMATTIDSTRISERLAQVTHDLGRYDVPLVRETLDYVGRSSS